MKLLLDTCVWGGALAILKNAGHDVIQTGESGKDPGDVEILAMAHSQTRVLITLDKDFAELAIVHGAPHSGMIRLVEISATAQADTVLKILQHHQAELEQKAIITAEPGRMRIRLEPRQGQP